MSELAAHRRAWLAIVLLFAGSVLNYVDRSVLGVVKPYVQQDLDLSNTGYGMAVNSFLLAYSVLYVLGGRLADRFGYRRMFSVSVLFWSAACMLHGLARGLGSLCLFRGLLGVGEGGFYPSAMKGASELFGPEDRAKPVGLLLCGLSVGALVTPPVVAWITLRYGWRAAFVATGMLGLLLVPVWLLVHRKMPPPAPLPDAAVPAGSVLAVLRDPKYLCILLARAITDVVWLFYLFWMPGYFQEARGFDLRAVGALLWIPFLCADLGALAGGWVSSGLIRRGWSANRGRKTVLVASAVLGLLGALTPVADSAAWALGLTGAALFGQLAWSTNVHTTITEIAPKQHVALLYGITGAAGNGLGALMQPVIGRVVDRAGYDPVFFATGVAYILAMAFIAAMGNIEPLKGSR